MQTHQMELTMDINFSWVKPTRGRSALEAGKSTTSGLAIYHLKNSTRDGKEEHQTCIRIGVDIMKAHRFVVGDRVIVGLAEAGGKRYIAIKRVPSDADGFKLSNPGGKSRYGTDNHYGLAKMKRREWPQLTVDLKNIKATGSGFFFCIDDAEVSHEGS
jgi:hypothetical protein